ncbi:hypothetical protein niasHT_033800 [Heterodera trifolii]|uniref:BTB domain-containing protein n=1 Tax=Heterodera trifolii TaxID=157864 RepID=A0ABD2J7E8_9BILA
MPKSPTDWMKMLLSKGEYADVHFLLVPAHKLILRNSSDVFEAMFRFETPKADGDIIDDQRLANLYVKILQKEDETLAQQNEVWIIYDEFALQRTNELLWRAKDQLMLEHCVMVTRLTVCQSAECQNALSRYLANSIGQMKGAKHRLRTFFTSPLKETTISDKLLQENNYFRQVFRSDLTPDEISQLQVKYYLNYIVSDSETDVHTRALFMANFLAFYHWFKKRQHKLTKEMQPELENLFLKIELQMDFIACSESTTNKAAKKAHKREMMSLRIEKDKLFPEEAQVIVIEKGEGNRSNSLATEISLLSMHNEIMEGLIKNEQHFLDKIKTIFINEQRLQKMIPRMTLAFQILMQNAKISRQQRNVNDGNEDEERGEGGEKLEEKREENGRVNGEVEGGGENIEGRKVEKEDEKTRESEEKGDKKEHEEERKAEENEESGGAVGEKGGREEKGVVKTRGIEEKVAEREGAAEEKGRKEEERGRAIGEKDREINKEQDKKGRKEGAENERCVDSDAKFDNLHEMDRSYLALFSSTGAETTFQAEIFLGIKLMGTIIDQTEKVVLNPANFAEIITTRAKLRAMMAVQLHFRDAQKFRIICGQISYVAYLVQKMNFQFTFWRSPTECFSYTREETLSAMRTVLRRSHWDYVVNRVTGAVQNGISDTVRHNRGALALLEMLIGGTAMVKLWENKEARAKLMEANFFLDKKRLVEHYLSALLTSDIAADSAARKRSDIKSADLIVWAQWFQSHIEKKNKGQSRHSLHRDYVWMYLRIAYDVYEIGTEKSEFEHTFTKMEKMMTKITELIISAGECRGSLMGKLREKWDEIITEVFAVSNLELEESVEQEMDIMEFIQQLHHRLRKSENCRNNLASFLSKEQMREIFRFVGIPLEEKEFEGTDQKITFPSDDQTEKGKDQKKKKQRKNRRKKNGQKLGMIEENESEKGEEKTENQKLLNEMMTNGLINEFAGCLSPAFPKISQQLIRDEFDEQNSQKLEQFVEEMAINGQTADGISRKKRDKRIKAAIDTINGMTAKWSIDKAKLFISGSFMFELNTTDSDIDLICVVPGNVIKKEHFLGEQNEICVEKKCENGKGEKQNLSTPKTFYCHLCENEKVNDLLKISQGQLMMLKFTFDGFDFDISFVAIPKLETLEHRITDRILRNYLTKFDNENVEHRQMIRVLTSYLSNVHIIKLMDENQKKTFIPNCDISKLEFDISNRGMTTNWHIYPALFEETCQITQKLQEIPAKNRSDFHHCKVWLIGTDQHLLNANEKRLINGKLLNFDWAIKRDFLKFNGKLSNKSGGDDINDQFQQMGLNLKSVFVPNMAHFLKSN